ncbi:Bifunctional ligase/repressor BirA [Diplonema papillatum]|nr:Bifunctional ligase/repressor BirA [Diplonema papillatum]|eukprot:gene18137-27934_t
MATDAEVTVVHDATLYHYGATSSTMDKAKELCKSEAHPGQWFIVLAKQQTSGRGTGGRGWLSPEGNVYASICVPRTEDVLPLAKLCVLPLETGLAVVSAIMKNLPPGSSVKALPSKAAADEQVSVKWPNDVLVADKKVSGCLIEDGGSHMIVGVGVNLAAAPPVADGGRPSGCLASLGVTVGPKDFTVDMFLALRAGLQDQSRDVVAVYGSTINWETTVYERNPDFTRGPPGKALRLTKDGHLVVLQEGKEKTLMNEYLF